MNIDKIISSLPSMSSAEREKLRANARKMVDSGSADQKLAATNVMETLDGLESAEHQDLVDRLNGMSQRVT